MKTILLSLAAAICLSSCAYERLGSLTEVSTRNIDSSQKYELVQKGVEAKATGRDPLQEAVDRAVAQHPDGEFLRNVVVYVKPGKVKVRGDIYGVPGSNPDTSN